MPFRKSFWNGCFYFCIVFQLGVNEFFPPCFQFLQFAKLTNGDHCQLNFSKIEKLSGIERGFWWPRSLRFYAQYYQILVVIGRAVSPFCYKFHVGCKQNKTQVKMGGWISITRWVQTKVHFLQLDRSVDGVMLTNIPNDETKLQNLSTEMEARWCSGFQLHPKKPMCLLKNESSYSIGLFPTSTKQDHFSSTCAKADYDDDGL